MLSLAKRIMSYGALNIQCSESQFSMWLLTISCSTIAFTKHNKYNVSNIGYRYPIATTHITMSYFEYQNVSLIPSSIVGEGLVLVEVLVVVVVTVVVERPMHCKKRRKP